MQEISNKTLVYVILLTLGVSLFSTFYSLNLLQDLEMGLSPITGRATNTQSGTASINLTTSVGIQLNVNSLDWGTGFANGSNPSCSTVRLTTNGTTNASNLNPNNCWTGGQAIAESDDFRIENTGNLPVLLEINSSNSTDFWGFGTASTTDFQWRALNNESGACEGTINSTWNEFDGTYQTVCTSLGWDSGNDEIYVELNISYLASEATAGVKTVSVDFQATNATG